MAWFKLFLLAGILALSGSSALAVPSAPDWLSEDAPNILMTRRLSDQHELSPSNTNCIPAVVTSSGTRRDDCLVETAFGLAGDSGLVLPGNDTAQRVVPPAPFFDLIGIPGQDMMMTYSTAPVVGLYVHFYRSIRYRLHAEGSRLVVDERPDFSLRLADGNLLPVSVSTLAFSPNGAWLVADAPGFGIIRVSMADFTVKTIAPSLKLPGSYSDQRAQITVSNTGRFVAIKPDNFDYLKLYDLTNCPNSPLPVPSDTVVCPPRDYLPDIRSAIDGYTNIYHLRLVSDQELSFEIRRRQNSTTYQEEYSLVPAGTARNGVPYLALGDSFASGEGAGWYRSGTDTSSNHCHVSRQSYAYILRPSAASIACSGAVTRDISSQSPDYIGQAMGNGRRADQSDQFVSSLLQAHRPGYIAQAEFVDHDHPRVITLSVGGNDAGFRDIISACVSPVALPKDCFNSYEERQELYRLIQSVYPRLMATYAKIQRPDQRLYIVGYPQIVASGHCPVNVRLGSAEISFAQNVTSYLNSVVRAAAEASGAYYIDISSALSGHELCGSSGVPAVNGLTAGSSAGSGLLHYLSSGSYHPNALGHRLIAAEISRQTHDLTAVSPLVATGYPMLPYLDADSLLPRFGRPLRRLSPEPEMISETVVRSSSTALVAPRNARALSQFTVSIGETTIGSLLTDSTGSFTATIKIPAGLPVGWQTVHVVGPDWLNNQVDDFKQVYVGASADDIDGDRTSNESDDCPFDPPKHVDADRDGIDDACDVDIAVLRGIVHLNPNTISSNP